MSIKKATRDLWKDVKKIPKAFSSFSAQVNLDAYLKPKKSKRRK